MTSMPTWYLLKGHAGNRGDRSALGSGWGSRNGTGGWARRWRAYPAALTLRTVALGLGCLLGQLLLPLRTSPKEDVVDKGVLQKGQEHKDEAAHEVHVNGFDVGDFGQRLPKVRVDGGHGQHGRDPCQRNRR